MASEADANQTSTNRKISSTVAIEILALPIPLWMGLAFRKTLKDELDKCLLSDRTYQICDYWIAQLLLLVYICLVIIHR
jgi:hypothetical protein